MSNDANQIEIEDEEKEVVYTEAEQLLLNRGLPKWPHLIIIGKPVTKDQAFEIILRTDGFLSDTSKFPGGNNRDFNRIYQRDSGIAELMPPENFDSGWFYTYMAQQALREKIKFVSFSYIRNDWAASSYIGGPHGFCSPDGEIYHNCNVGKWPSIEEVYEDLKKMVATWPFLTFKASLYDCEECENTPEKQMVASFVAENGVVTITGEDFDLRNQERPGIGIEKAVMEIHNGMHREQGLPWRWIMEYAEIIKSHIPAAKATADDWYNERMESEAQWAREVAEKKARNLAIMARLKTRVSKSRSRNRKAKAK